jgi:carbamoyl-phosphate synthase large subunit
MANVLVTCGGRWVGLILQLREALRAVPALRGGRLLVGDRAALQPAGCLADASFLVPGLADPHYVDCLLDLCCRYAVRVLVPHLDADLDRLAPCLRHFAEVGTTVVCPPPELVELCRDKGHFEAFARAEGLPCPRSYPADSLHPDLFPLFAKPRRGTASPGSGVCRSLEEARTALARNRDLLFQEVLTGPEVSVDAYLSASGRCVVRVPRWRDKVVDGEAVQSHTFRSAPLNALADRTLAALARRGLRGPVNVQFFAGDRLTLLEANTRLGSATVLANMATGGRLFASVLAEACGASCAGDPDDYQEGLHLYRFLGEMYHDGTRPLRFFPGGDAS